jgi:glycosyltransferase involved in cell wall biosynthesis
MNILFLHNNFPGQFLNLAVFLTQNAQNDVYFISRYGRDDIRVPNLKCLATQQPPEIEEKDSSRKALLEFMINAELFAVEMVELKKKGFYPDVICDHPGWGCGMYAPEIFPRAARICHFEWFYNKGVLHNFFTRGRNRSPEPFTQNRQRNLCLLDALMECDVAITPTLWQLMQHPPEYLFKFHVIHDGINTDFFSPQEAGRRPGSVQELDLGAMEEIVTYTARGMEPFRGFPQFFKSIPEILKARPKCHVVIMANDTVHYSPPRPDGISWGQAMRNEVQVDDARVHFLNHSAYPDYLKVLRASSVHVYLTAPFVLSWSLLEAMSCGCLVVASNTEPVREVIRHGENGYLTDFWNETEIASVVIDCLENRKDRDNVRLEARKTVLDRYDGRKLVPQKAYIMQEAIARRHLRASLPQPVLQQAEEPPQSATADTLHKRIPPDHAQN